MSITVEAVAPGDAAAMRRFIRLPERLMRSDPAFVAPLRLEREEALSPAKNPFFQHAEVRFWLARRDGRDVGRISAQVDRLLPAPVGHFGLLAAEDDPGVFAALTEAAEGWLREQGMPEAIGPFSLSVNEEAGLLVDGFEAPPMLLTPHDPPYAGARLEGAGYAKVRDIYAYLFSTDAVFSPAVAKRLERGVPPGVRLRPPDMTDFEREVRTIASIVNDAWSSNWGFAPWTEAETLHLAKSLKPLLDTRLVRFVEVDGEDAGFIAALPNLNEAARDLGGRLAPFGWARLLWRLKIAGVESARVPLMGVRPRFARRAGGSILTFLLMDAVLREGRRAGYRQVEASWILEDNGPMRRIMESMGARRYKTWRLYRKAL